MVLPGFEGQRRWLWSWVLVSALHLLSTGGGWWITDHGEILAVADRFAATGHLDLQDLGPGWEAWTRIVAHRPSTETRFLPLSILPLVPFLALDHYFGWRDPGSYRVVHLEGHFFVLIGLLLTGRFIQRSSGQAATAALSILLLGLSWPVWMIARRVGPEPILFALLAAFATQGPRTRFFCLLLLPWVHASGPVLGLGALLWLALREGSARSRPVGGALVGWTLGSLSVAFLWNLPRHGHALMGGYHAYAQDAFFVVNNPVFGTLSFLGAMVVWTLPLWYLAVHGGRRTVLETLALWLPALVFFGLFSRPEPLRRLAPLLGAWIIVLFVRLPPLPPARTLGLAALALISGVVGLSRDFVDLVSTPLGLYSGPRLLFVRLAFVDHQLVLALALVIGLLVVVFAAGSRTVSLLCEPGEARRAP